jgi:hypothetical protein
LSKYVPSVDRNSREEKKKRKRRELGSISSTHQRKAQIQWHTELGTKDVLLCISSTDLYPTQSPIKELDAMI